MAPFIPGSLLDFSSRKATVSYQCSNIKESAFIINIYILVEKII